MSGRPKAICKVPDCVKIVNGLGLCPMHYRRYRMSGTVADPVVDPLKRFIASTDFTEACWLWRGNKFPAGYGQFVVGKSSNLAHRWIYQVLVGPISEGLVLDHLCGTPSCVNPEHLEPVTQQVNTLRGISPAAVNAKKTHCIRGHAFDTGNTYINPSGQRQCRRCMKIRMSESKSRHLTGGTPSLL
jgi:hypothetical protein